MDTAASSAQLSSSVHLGDLVRGWRRRRGVSQMDLALAADVSTRHLSFVETGRSVPSRELVLRLAEALQLPLRDRNVLLLSAGYAPLYLARPLEADAMEPIRSTLDRFLRAHEPFPALVVDRHHDIIATNDALADLMTRCASWLLAPPANAIRVALHPEGLGPATVNLEEWSGHLIGRLAREVLLTGDPVLEQLLEEVSAYPGVRTQPPAPGRRSSEIAVPLRLRHRGTELCFLSTIAVFGTAIEVTASELAIEAFYPANAETALHMLEAVR